MGSVLLLALYTAGHSHPLLSYIQLVSAAVGGFTAASLCRCHVLQGMCAIQISDLYPSSTLQ